MNEEISADAFQAEPVQGEIVTQNVPTLVDLSALNDEEKAEVGRTLEQEVIGDNQHVMVRYLRIGRNLFLVSKNNLYKQMGYESFDEWRAQPEMNVSRSTAYALMKVFEVFVERLKVGHERLAGLDWTRLYSISQFVNSENVEEYLEKVRTLSRTDLQREAALERARLSGKTPEQADAVVSILDTVREACPINCGAKCSLIDADQDAAVESFKKFLGRYKALQARIKSLIGKTFPVQKQTV